MGSDKMKKSKHNSKKAKIFYYAMKEEVLVKYKEYRFKVPVNSILSEILNKDPATITAWKQGRIGINHIQDFYKLSQAFNLSLDQLYLLYTGEASVKRRKVIEKYSIPINRNNK